MGEGTDDDREAMSPAWIAPIVTWLASEESAGVTGRVFEASGRVLAVAEGWVRGPTTAPVADPTLLGSVVEGLLAEARPNSGMDGTPGGPPQPNQPSLNRPDKNQPDKNQPDKNQQGGI
jgi:hypothetical protein